MYAAEKNQDFHLEWLNSVVSVCLTYFLSTAEVFVPILCPLAVGIGHRMYLDGNGTHAC